MMGEKLISVLSTMRPLTDNIGYQLNIRGPSAKDLRTLGPTSSLEECMVRLFILKNMTET